MKKITKKELEEIRREAIQTINETHGKGYAKEHPFLVDAFVLHWRMEQLEDRIDKRLEELKVYLDKSIEDARDEIKEECLFVGNSACEIGEELRKFNNGWN